MVHKNNPHGRKKSYRFALTGILALTIVSVGVTLTQHISSYSLAQGNLVKDDSVIASDEPEAQPNSAISTLQSPDSKALITTYTIKSGDTLGSIAQSFHISADTIRWANDLPVKSTIKVGQELVILPFTGIKYVVKKGDTLSAITVKYGGDKNEVMNINGLEDEKTIKPGDTLLIPDGEIPDPKPVPKKVAPVAKSTTTQSVVTGSESTTEKKSDIGTKYINPISGAILTQGVHADNAVDFGAPIGTAVRAAANGTVVIAKSSGYNGGYGNYVVINHDNGVQTLYAHLSKVLVSAGSAVSQADEIGKSGNSGKSTGPHLHFGVHGATNQFGDDPKGTHY